MITKLKNLKSSSPVAWTCDIDDCNKQFAREADLKRHKHTARAHFLPNSGSKVYVHACSLLLVCPSNHSHHK